MAYDGAIAGRIREFLVNPDRVTGRKMFGGVGFMLRGNMCRGVTGDGLMLCVGPESMKRPCVCPMPARWTFQGNP